VSRCDFPKEGGGGAPVLVWLKQYVLCVNILLVCWLDSIILVYNYVRENRVVLRFIGWDLFNIDDLAFKLPLEDKLFTLINYRHRIMAQHFRHDHAILFC
jgi:hypothetical protein